MNKTLLYSPAGRGRFEIRDAERVVASVFYGSIGQPAARVFSDGADWTIKRSGLFRPRVAVRLAGCERDLLVARARWSGDYKTAEDLKWKCTDLFKSEFSWLRRGERIILYRGQSIWDVEAAFIDVLGQQDEVPVILIVLGAFLRKLALDDLAVTTVAAAG